MESQSKPQSTTAAAPPPPPATRRRPDDLLFVTVATAAGGGDGGDDNSSTSNGHAVGITADGTAYSWGRTSRLGQLGRPGRARTPAPVVYQQQQQQQQQQDSSAAAAVADDDVVQAVRAYVGGLPDAGHTAIVDARGRLWMAGCDRWQQLGLGSANGGASGYTWTSGKVFQTAFRQNAFVPDYLRQLNDDNSDSNKNSTTTKTIIRDVAIGGDHTVVLSSNQRDVVTFGKGAEGQLGLTEKRFVSAPTRSSVLSSSPAASESSKIAAVCAMDYCSLTLDAAGDVLKTAGRCRTTQQSFWKSLEACRERASSAGLIQREAEQ